MRQTIATTSLPLRSLGVFGHLLSQSNVQRFSTLVELSLALIPPRGPIEMVFTHCSRLRSLTLLVGGAPACDLATTLRTHSDALPLLTAFQLFYPRMGPDMSEAMVSFLRNKLLLERLDLGHHRSLYAFDEIEPVLDILPGLPRLHVFGAELSGSNLIRQNLTPDHLQYLAQRVPARLTALSVCVGAHQSTLTKEDWEQFFSGLSSCRFIYFSVDHSYLGAHVLQSTLLEHPPPLAELVGFNVDIAWVERDPETGRVGYSERWPLSRVYNRTAGEFGCEEWEWLLRQADDRFS
ncbi:hypothetical protein GSI_12091 [Ganoderma sinense ZZ0214-1]|uniref:Uncharacterized protein n=1 Tax=Ganoderma sinense ZZ0214-1 TaxID=1077348 RepID=A0A2G8RXU6_9APHY|nr:hypothetical protein GSI_12091 [Ganoderma sinense ZZ0214-1]